MKSWEFLLQKEGDRTWLPLENPTVEILEGRYRVVARTPCAQEAVDIYVSFVSSQDDPPKRRIQQRSHAANDDGLLAILPFTPFRPGRWELRCRPHGAAGETAQQWPSQIELQVLSQESQGDDDDLFGWDHPQDDGLGSQVTATDASPTLNEAEPSVAPGLTEPSPTAEPVQPPAIATPSAANLDPATASEADFQRLAAEMSQMVAESVAQTGGTADRVASGVEALEAEVDYAPNLPSPGFTAAIGITSDSSESNQAASVAGGAMAAQAAEGPGIAIALETDVVMMESDRHVAVRGQILRPGSSSASPGDALLPSELLLTVELRDPSTTEIWASYRESFRQAMAPVSFTGELQLPTACRTQLLLGNATLWQVEANGNLERLVSQDFNAMAAVDALLDHARQSDPVAARSLQEGAVSNLQQQAASNFLVTKFGAKPSASRGNVKINTELLNLLKPTARSSAEGQGNGGSGSVGNRAIAARPVGSSRLELPRFGNARPVAMPLADSLADDLADDLADNLALEMNANPSDELALSSAALEAELATSSAPALPLDEAEDNPFALPLDGDLDSLSLTEELGRTAAFEPGDDAGTAWAGDLLAGEAGEPPSSPQADWAGAAGDLSRLGDPVGAVTGRGAEGGALLDSPAGLTHEVVVDDEDSQPPVKLAWMQPSPSPGLVDEDISVPAPELTVPDGELVKGQPLRIQVRVTQEPARLCARVWLLDCQSRTLLGEPLWITAFLPLGDDWMEANVDWVVPEGSIELQVEAIAVEPITQRESRKVSTRRKVSLGGDTPEVENW